MATLVTTIDTVTAWVQANICDKVKLKKPPLNETDATDAGYKYELVTPYAFAMYVPTQDKITLPDVAPIPSVCVRITDGENDLTAGKNTITFEMVFSTWSTGTHGEEIINPVDGSATFQQWRGAEADNHFVKNGEGWRDAWNMIDLALQEIGNTTNMNGLEIDRSVPLKFAPLKEQEAIADYYPYWFATVTFGIKQPIRSNISEIQNLL